MVVGILKIAILTDSLGNPRSIPEVDKCDYANTYPALLRNKFSSAEIYQLSVGNVTCNYLINQFVGYFNDWKPEVIILHAGINYAKRDMSLLPYHLVFRLEKNFQRILGISFLKILANLRLLKFRTEVKEFKNSIIMLRDLFPSAKIIYLPIICTDKLEFRYLNIMERSETLNDCVSSITGIHSLKISNCLFKKNGVASDGMHLNFVGHCIIADRLSKMIKGENNEFK